jgi:putative transposase
MNPHFKALEAAYQLHFYVCLKTRYRRPILKGESEKSLVQNVLKEICAREEYHLLETDTSQDHLRLLVSLQPTHTVSGLVRTLKGNLDQRFRLNFQSLLEANRLRSLWARGYFARSSGKVSLDNARRYVEGQASHHGYRGHWTKGLHYKNPTFRSPAFKLGHCLCLLNYHIVLATQHRLAIFDESMAPGLFDYVTSIGAKHRFAVDRIGLLPDHMHLVLEAVPSVSVEQIVRAIMENTWYWITTRYSGTVKQMEAWDIWQPSFYAGTVGEYSTAQIKRFLESS